MSGAISITTAVIAIGVAAEVGTTFAIIAAVGATVGAVGAITGVKELKYAGMAIGAVGAIGGLASSAGLFAGTALGEGAAAQAAGLASDVGFVAPGAGETMAGIMQTAEMSGSLPGAYAGMEAVNAGSGMAPLFDAGQYQSIGDVIDIVNGVNATPAVDPMAAINPMADANTAAGLPAGGNEQLAPGSSGTMGDTTPDAVPAPSMRNDPQPSPLLGEGADPAETSSIINSAPQPAPSAITPTGAPTKTVAGVDLPTGTGQPAAGGAPTPFDPEANASGFAMGAGPKGPSGAPGAGSSSSVWSDIMSTIGKPGVGTLLSGAVQAGGAFIAGATDTLKPAQIKMLETQAQQNLAATNLANQQAATLARQEKNFNSPVPVATKKPPAGLLNTPVTGQVA